MRRRERLKGTGEERKRAKEVGAEEEKRTHEKELESEWRIHRVLAAFDADPREMASLLWPENCSRAVCSSRTAFLIPHPLV